MAAKLRIGSIVVRCYEFERMFEFWRQALRYEPREPPKAGWVVCAIRRERGQIYPWISTPNVVWAKEAGCISISMRKIVMLKWSGSCRSARSATPGDTSPGMTSWSCKIPTTISFAWCKRLRTRPVRIEFRYSRTSEEDTTKPLHLLVISEARSVFHSAATARRPPLNGSSRPAEMVRERQVWRNTCRFATPGAQAARRRIQTSRSSLNPWARLNSLGFGPRLDDSQELCGILFGANFLVAQAIDEPLD